MDGSGDHNGWRRRNRHGRRRCDWTAADERRHEMNGGGAMDSGVINGWLWRQRWRRCAAAVCGGGVRLFSVTRDGTLRGEMKIYVKDMSGHKFAERGGGRSANLCFYDQHTYNRV